MDALSSCRSVLQLRDTLRSLPETLVKTYERILCKISKRDYHYAIQILRWLSFCARSLCLAEVAEVIAIDSKESLYVDPNKRFKDPYDILEICLSLISVEESEIVPYIDSPNDSCSDADIYANSDDALTIDTDIVSETSRKDERQFKTTIMLAHFSVKEYLVSDRIRHGSASKYSLEEAQSNGSIAEDCLSYLLHVIQPKIWMFVSLEEYFLRYWFEHIRFAERAPSTAFTLTNELFMLKEDTFVNWISLYNPDKLVLGWSSFHRKSGGPPLYYASLLGLLGPVATLIEKGADVNAQGGWYENALKVASTTGHVKIVQLLLDNGADIDAHSEKSIATALEGASWSGHIETVQLLLDLGAHITSRGGQSPLTMALY